MSTSKNLKLTTWLGGLLTPQFLSTALAVVVTAVLLPVGNTAWGGGPEGNEGVADRGAVRPLQTIPVPGALKNPTRGKQHSFDITWGAQPGRTHYLAALAHFAVDGLHPQ